MKKRPLNPRFNEAVLNGTKYTTIRDTPWTVGEHIMLYNWSGAPYRSKQNDVCAVVAELACKIVLHRPLSGEMRYMTLHSTPSPLYESEGFASQSDMDKWFAPSVRQSEFVTKYLMAFKRIQEPTE